MKIKELMETSAGTTSSSSVAAVSQPMGGIVRRSKKSKKSIDATKVNSFNLESKTSDKNVNKR